MPQDPSSPENERWPLEIELQLVFDKINHFDDLRHRTLQLSIAISVAAVGTGFTVKSSAMLFLAALVPLPFWYQEARYHSHQEGFSLRWIAIERYLSGRWTNERPFPIPDFYGSRTSSVHETRTSLRRNVLRPRAVAIYGGSSVVLLCLGVLTSVRGF